MTSTAPAVSTAFSTVITATDFSNNVTEPRRDEWTPGKMRHAVAALAGAPVAITTDKLTGHTIVGATLGDIRKTPYGGTFDVLVISEHNRTYYPIDKIGAAIIPLDEGFNTGAKYTAKESWRRECSAAVRADRAKAGTREKGEFVTVPGADYVDVEYREIGENGRRYYARYTLAELARA